MRQPHLSSLIRRAVAGALGSRTGGAGVTSVTAAPLTFLAIASGVKDCVLPVAVAPWRQCGG
jgi:hypothetical protein